jgi:hypothetical protein
MKKVTFLLLLVCASFISFAQTTDTTFHGTIVSKAPEATSVTVTWTQVSGPTKAVISDIHSLQPTVTNLGLGNYVFQLDGVDNLGVPSLPSTLSFSVVGSGTKPVVSAGQPFTIKLGSRP